MKQYLELLRDVIENGSEKGIVRGLALPPYLVGSSGMTLLTDFHSLPPKSSISKASLMN